ncbi:hypothetical protein OPIT5_10160 [Opitutaceae bacterium TAV5]|nr:hypothetical protein OPIT5_10160 [Opitutaceae bacterium TAV5]
MQAKAHNRTGSSVSCQSEGDPRDVPEPPPQDRHTDVGEDNGAPLQAAQTLAQEGAAERHVAQRGQEIAEAALDDGGRAMGSLLYF